MKNTIFVIFSVCLLLLFLPVTALDAATEECLVHSSVAAASNTPTLFIEGEALSLDTHHYEGKGWAADYDPDGFTVLLTLNGYGTKESPGAPIGGSNIDIIVVLSSDDNYMKCDGNKPQNSAQYGATGTNFDCALYTNLVLNITGEGSLHITATNSKDTRNACGIYAGFFNMTEGNLYIDASSPDGGVCGIFSDSYAFISNANLTIAADSTADKEISAIFKKTVYGIYSLGTEFPYEVTDSDGNTMAVGTGIDIEGNVNLRIDAQATSNIASAVGSGQGVSIYSEGTISAIAGSDKEAAYGIQAESETEDISIGGSGNIVAYGTTGALEHGTALVKIGEENYNPKELGKLVFIRNNALIPWDGTTAIAITPNDNVYRIENPAQLAWLASVVNDGTEYFAGKTIELASDIDLGDEDWTPIGTETNGFAGVFDGKGYNIYNIKTESIDASPTGLFGCITDGAVKNLTVSGSVNGVGDAGGIVGINQNGAIENCINQTTVHSESTSGGICGANKGSVGGCLNSGSVEGAKVGGISGSNQDSITACINIGLVAGTDAGGIVGSNNGIVRNCYNTANVTATQLSGSIAAYNEAETAFDITNCCFLQGTAAKGIGNGNGNANTVAKTEAEMKAPEFVAEMNKDIAYFTADTQKLNHGYPVLLWQMGIATIFPDVSGWYAEYVYDLVAKGIINGKTATTFAPNDDITRAEFAKILAAASEEDLSAYGGNSSFVDVKAGAWYVTYINWAYAKGIVNGKSASAFAPNDNITRQEMAVMIGRYATSYNITLPETETPITFADAASIADWAKDAVSAMQKTGIINGKPGNLFDPNGNAERCEAAKMVSIFLSLR